jgi:hypothetical protein
MLKFIQSIDFTMWGSLAILIGTAMTIYGASKEKKDSKIEADSLRTQIGKLQDQNHLLDSSLNSKLDTNAVSVDRLKDDLIEKANENSNLSLKLQEQTDKLVKYQNGGGAVPSFYVYTVGTMPNRIGFEISNQTKIPIKIIRVVIRDVTAIQHGETGHMDSYQAEQYADNTTTTLTDVGVLPAHSMISRYSVFSKDIDPSVSETIYDYYITWEHGYMWGRYTFTRNSDGTLKAVRSGNGVQLNDESF